jgi:tRNA(Ile)-lysidine synthetase-like protein
MKNFTKTGFFISSKIGKAIGDYNLIEDGDRILVAASGGKDSLTLLKLLRERQRWAPAKFEIVAAHIETDLKCGYSVDKDFLIKIFKDLGVKYRFKKIKLLDKKDDINCFWCSWNRRKTLFKTAYNLGCNKVALGHHKDDIIETTLLNLFFQGEISTMNPRQELFDGKIVIIRPLCYVEEKTIKKFAKENGFFKNIEKSTKLQDSNRRYVKELIKDIKKRCPNVKTNIFRSITRVKSGYINLKED